MEPSFTFKIFLYLIIIFSAVFHEYFHGWLANYLGDPTAKYAGRLTLNPLKHIDPMGTVMIPLFLLFFANIFIGWAKPVPYNPYNLRDQRYGSAKVALAGPASNILIALLFGLILRFFSIGGFYSIAFSWIIYINIFLAFFNLIPIPPLDGSKLLMDFFPGSRALRILEQSFIGMLLAIVIAVTFLPIISSILYYFIVDEQFLALIF